MKDAVYWFTSSASCSLHLLSYTSQGHLPTADYALPRQPTVKTVPTVIDTGHSDTGNSSVETASALGYAKLKIKANTQS